MQLMTFILLIVFKVSAALGSFQIVSVATNPKTVGSSATLTFTATLKDLNYADGDQIAFNVPSPGQFTPSTSLSLCTTTQVGISITSCTITANQVQMTLSVTVTTTKAVLSVGNFLNPSSTYPISGITTSLVSSSGTSKAIYSITRLENLQPDALKAASISPGSDQIGDTGTTITVSLTTKNILRSTGRIIVYFPYWNPLASYGNSHYLSITNPTCTGVTTNTVSSISCTYNQDSRLLTLSSPLKADVSGGTTITFTVNSFNNPYSGVPRTGFYIYTTDSQNGQIDSSDGTITISIQVSTWATFSDTGMSRTDGVTAVGQTSEGNAYIQLDFPVDPTCRLKIVFPGDMPVTSDISSVQGAGIFIATTSQQSSQLTSSVSGNFITVNGCYDYNDSPNKGVIFIQDMKNAGQVKNPTGTFEFYLYAVSGGTLYPIAKQTSGITISDLTAGTITSFAVTGSDSKTIQAFTKYKLTLKPSTSMPTNSKFVITFPTTITLVDGSCTLSSVTGVSTTPTSCTVKDNVLTIVDPFGSSGSYTWSSSGTALSFIFSTGGTNPISVKDSGTFTVNTYAKYSGTYYIVDTYSSDGLYTPTPGVLTATVSQVSSYITYNQNTDYELSITPNKEIPKNGDIQIQFPTQITLTGSTITSCQYFINGVTKTSNSFTMVSTSPIQIKISDAFTTSAYTSTGTAFIITCSGLTNPRTTATTSSFQIYTYDQDDYAIEYATIGVTTAMTSYPSITTFSVVPSSYVNGASTTYKYSVKVPLPLNDGDVLYFTFPSEVTLPNSLSCTPLTNIKTISCSKSGMVITATMTFTGGQLSDSTTFTFQISNVQNPPDTRQSSTFSDIYIKDSTGLTISSYSSNVYIQTTTAATVITKSLAQDSQAIDASTTYTITYTAVNKMPSGSAFEITYPSSVTISSLSTCQVVYQSVTYSMTGCTIDPLTSKIYVATGFDTAVTAGKSIQIVLSPIQNPSTQKNSGTFTLTSYTDSTYTYKIDNIPSGLVPQFECNWPCETCDLPDKNICLSCLTSVSTETYKYLYNGQCLTACPTGYYSDSDLQCQACPSSCLTCSDSSTCTSCDQSSTIPYLYNGWCVSSCPANYCPILFVCSTCTASSFTSVTVTATPSTVNTDSILKFVATLDPTLSGYYANNDIINFVIPSPGSFTPSTSSSLCSSTTTGISVSSCTIYSNQVAIKLTVTDPLISTFTVSVDNFINPPSTTTITGITTYLIDSTGNAKAIYTTTTLSNITPEKMTVASITPFSKVVGDTTYITVSFTLMNALTTTGQIEVLIPYWNPSSSSPSHMILSTAPTCTGVSVDTIALSTSLSCTYSQSTRTLLLSGSILSTDAPSGTQLSFTVDNFKNPYNGQPKTAFQISTKDSGGGYIDQSATLSIQTNTFATIDSATIDRTGAASANIVGDYSSLQFTLTLNLPVDANCKLRIYFPDDQPVNIVTKTVSSATGLLSSTSSSATTNIASKYVELTGCYGTYKDASQSASAILASTVNIGYFSDTQTFSFELYDTSTGINYRIAQITSGLQLKTSSLSVGSIYDFQIAAEDSKVIDDTTRFQITLTPTHDIPNDNKIVIEFPSTIQLTVQSTTSCLLSSTSGGISTKATCEVNSSNQLIIYDAFGLTASYSGSMTGKASSNTALSFIFSTGGTNPSVSKDVGTFTVTTYAEVSNTYYMVDSSSFTNKYTPDPYTLTAKVFDVSSFQTSDSPVSYTLQLTPQKIITLSGKITITFPKEVSLQTGSTSVSSCTYKNVAGQTLTVSTTMVATSPVQVQITDAFSSSAFTSTNQNIYFTCSGLTNPRTTATTSSFTIITSDSSGNPIEKISTGVTTAMKTLASITAFTAVPTSKVNGVSNQYKISVTSSVEVKSTDIILFTFPSEITGPSISYTGTICSAISPYVTSITCTVVSTNRISAVLKTLSPSTLPAKTTFQFNVNGVTNPPSSKPSSAFTLVQGTDSSGNTYHSYTGSAAITNTIPATASGTLSQINTAFGATTTYTITYSTMNAMVSQPSWVITYPSSVTVPTKLTTCNVVYAGITYAHSYTINTSQRTIKIYAGSSQGVSVAIPKSSQIYIQLGPITNPTSQLDVQTLTLVSYTDNTFQYYYDSVASGLIPSYFCTFPCKTCLSTNKTACTSCFTTVSSVSQKYLNSTSCLQTCPTGFYGDTDYNCQDCPDQCGTCYNSSYCITCNTTAKSKYPFMFNNWCYSKCPDGFYSSANQCLRCNPNCKTCNVSATNCTSCNTNTTLAYLQNRQCVSKCDSGYVSINYQCQKCKAPCSQCLLTQTTCTGCSTGYLYGTQCVSKCPTGTTQSGTKCLGCDPKCQSCSPTDPTRCLLCNTGYYLLNNTCYSSCPDGYKLDVDMIYCSPIQYNNTNNTNNTGNNTGPRDNSVIKAVAQYENPDNETYVYFPFTITQTIMGGVAAGSFFKDRGSLWHSNSLGLWGPIEMVAYGSQVYLSYNQLDKQEAVQASSSSLSDSSNSSSNSTSNSTKSKLRRMLDGESFTSTQMGIVPLVFYGTCLSLIVKIVTNIIFAMIFLMIIRKDNGFKEYCTTHNVAPYVLFTAGTIFSFKLYKFFYSRFFGLETFYIPLENPERMHQAMNILTILNMVLSLLPMIFIDVYGVIKYQWGNQFYVMMIESLILSLSMIVFQIIEFKAQKVLPKPYAEAAMYSQVPEMSANMDELIMQRLDEEMRKKFGGQTLEEFIEKLKSQHQLYDEQETKGRTNGKTLIKAKSMVDLGDREHEEDERRVNTDPLDSKKQKAYGQKPNPFERILKYDDDIDHPDNCYAVKSRTKKPPVDKDRSITKVIQTGDKVMSGDEYDKDFERRLIEKGRQSNLAEERKDSRLYGNKARDEDDEQTPLHSKKKKNMRGRKGKYYSQVDDEDQSFLDQEKRMMDEDEEDEADDDGLHMIEEESQGSEFQMTHRQKSDEENNRLIHTGESIQGLKDTINHLEDQILEDQIQERQSLLNKEENEEVQFFEEEVAHGEGAILQSSPEHNLKAQTGADHIEYQQHQQQLRESQLNIKRDGQNKELSEEEILNQASQDKQSELSPEKSVSPRNHEQLLEDQIAAEGKSGVDAQNFKQQIDDPLNSGIDENQLDIDGTNPKFKSTEDIRKEIEQMIINKPNTHLDEDQIIKEQDHEHEEDKEQQLTDNEKNRGSDIGEPDSDDDDDLRIKNMTDPDKKRFNVNDILGEFDRDERGNPLILQDKKGELVDKDGNRVNEKGYLIDENTGDVVEKEKKRKIFDFNSLDDRGELPPPFNLERFNFNPHDVRGHFDRDADGNEIIRNRKDQNGNLIDKLGRRVNQQGYLIDNQGNLVDKRGRIKLNKHMLDQTGGEIPQLFNYKGKKFDIKDVMGDVDKDRNGNIIIRRDKDNKMVDKKGRLINNKGYLIDKDGNVINRDGKMMFEKFTLSKDNEIPKLFPFLKFNLDDIKGDYEMDPLGNPMLQKTRDGQLVDSKGRRVNEKGYLLDADGNVVNKKRKKVFNKFLLEEDGDIPKIFRTGLLRKDTYDSFSQLMSEIEDLERLQEMEVQDPKLQAKIKKKMQQDNDRLQKKIDQIVEEDNDDDDLLMKELEDLANDGGLSDGGNTSVDSMMEDTPSNYNTANQRFNELEQMKNAAKRNVRMQQQVPEDEEYSEYSYLPDRKLKKKKKKKKKKVKKEPTIDERELMMAKAYGGLSQAQYDKLVQMKKMQLQSQMSNRPPIQRNASNTQMSTLMSQKRAPPIRFNGEDAKSEWGESQADMGAQAFLPHGVKKGNQSTLAAGNLGISAQMRNEILNNTTSRMKKDRDSSQLPKRIIKNNLIGGQSQRSGADPEEQKRMRQTDGIMQKDRDRRLSNVANSVTGFYKDQAATSEHSGMSRTQDSFAYNIGNQRKLQQQEDGGYVGGPGMGGVPGEIGPGGKIKGFKKQGFGGKPIDPELERIYGTARGGLADLTMLSDWEKDSNRSGKSALSQFTQINTLKVKGLETIYLQRLEPAKKGKKGQVKGNDKAKFRVMHHKYHDEPEWYVDENRDELDSIISGNYKEMQKKFDLEFQGNNPKKVKGGKNGQNLFNGNLKGYKEKKYQESVPGADLSKV